MTNWHRLHTLFSKRRRNSQKRPEMRSRGGDFKPNQAEFRLTAKAARDYTKRPEVTPVGVAASALVSRVIL
jgi:hypothetical protein